MRRIIDSASDGSLGKVQDQALLDRDDVLVLFRTRTEVLSGVELSVVGWHSHRIRMSGTPPCLHPSIGTAFWDLTDS